MHHLVNPNQHRKKNYNTESCDPRPRNAVRTVCGTRRNISNGYKKKLRLVIFPFCQYLRLFNVNMCPSLRCIKYLCTVHTIYNAIVYSAGPVIMQFFSEFSIPSHKAPRIHACRLLCSPPTWNTGYKAAAAKFSETRSECASDQPGREEPQRYGGWDAERMNRKQWKKKKRKTRGASWCEEGKWLPRQQKSLCSLCSGCLLCVCCALKGHPCRHEAAWSARNCCLALRFSVGKTVSS